MFDADGAGLEFIAYEPDDVRIERENPFLNRAEMRRVMARSLRLYQQRHVGRSPRRVVVHKTSEFKPEEIDGCFEALHVAETVELLQIQQNVPWRGVKIEPPRWKRRGKGVPANYPCERGSYFPLGDLETLLWTQGNAREALGKDYYKEGKSIPNPIIVVGMPRTAPASSTSQRSNSASLSRQPPC